LGARHRVLSLQVFHVKLLAGGQCGWLVHGGHCTVSAVYANGGTPEPRLDNAFSPSANAAPGTAHLQKLASHGISAVPKAGTSVRARAGDLEPAPNLRVFCGSASSGAGNQRGGTQRPSIVCLATRYQYELLKCRARFRTGKEGAWRESRPHRLQAFDVQLLRRDCP
jgi:hypothetical protein